MFVVGKKKPVTVADFCDALHFDVTVFVIRAVRQEIMTI
jgi:hypothetical protein